MLDHTYNGTPVRRIPDNVLDDLLADGAVAIRDAAGYAESYAQFCIMERLKIERLRRDLGLPIRD